MARAQEQGGQPEGGEGTGRPGVADAGRPGPNPGQVTETERGAERGRGEGNMTSTQTSTGEGGTTKKRLLGGHAAKAAARHRQRVALQQAMREQSAEEGVT